MAHIELTMPKMGESVAEATITKWIVQEGEQIEAEESVLEIATDKVDSEIPAPASGTITKHLFKEGDVVKVGEVIAILETEGVSNNTSSSTPTAEAAVKPQPIAETVGATSTTSNNGSVSLQKITKNSANGKFFSPLVRSIAQKENISAGELEQIQGSGLNDRVTKKDILAYIANRGEGVSIVESPAAPAPQTVQQTQVAVEKKTEVKVYPGDEIVEMDRMRKLIAEHMVASKRTSPHVTSFVEADVTNIVKWRNKVKKSFMEREGENITFTPIFIEAITKAIKDFPNINVSVDGTNIINRKSINIGMATALPSGNLIVPVIKNADRLNLVGLAKAVNDLANRARENKLEPDEIQGGTYTLTNVGTFGNVMGTPIINQPQVAIMAFGAIRKIPAVIETPQGDAIAIRHKLFLSHAYDHRVVDGALGGMFVRRVADYLESFDLNREI